MQNSLEALAAKQAVHDTAIALFVRTDKRDWEGVRAVFADKVRFDMTSTDGSKPRVRSAVDIVAEWKEGLSELAALHHQIGNLVVTLGAEGEAHVTCYGTAWHYKVCEDGRNTRTFVGTYDLDLRRGDAAWKITSFAFHQKFVEGNPDL